jgi:hypothetical protein
MHVAVFSVIRPAIVSKYSKLVKRQTHKPHRSSFLMPLGGGKF